MDASSIQCVIRSVCVFSQGCCWLQALCDSLPLIVEQLEAAYTAAYSSADLKAAACKEASTLARCLAR